jgi:hypothetical protein
VLLLAPAVKLYYGKKRQDAILLFNLASYYPLSLLVITLILWLIS